MGRVLIRDEWFNELASDAQYELEFERALVQRASILFPGFTPAVFRRTVYSPEGAAKPDFALIDHQYREWWVVEVELAHHSFTSHVLPQVRALASAHYGPEVAEFLADRNSSLDSQRLPDLLKGAQPRVMVIVNVDRPDWEAPLHAIGARLIRFQIYRSAQNELAFSFLGDIPRVDDGAVSRCWVDRALPWMLTIGSPGALAIARNEPIELLFEGQVGKWSRIDSSDKVWLMPQ